MVSPEPHAASADDAPRTRERLIDLLVGCEAVLFGAFTLTSGAKSAYYVDIKKATTEPEILRLVAEEIGRRAEGPDLVAGMALGAVPLAVAVALETDTPFVMIRKETRAHGTGKRIEGPDVDGKHVLVVEDVATSGGSTVQAVEALREAGATVTDAYVVVDRESGAEAALAAVDVRLHSLVRAADLLGRVPDKEA